MRKALWIVGTFVAMYITATVIGFASYLLIGPRAMWFCAFTIMPVISALLIYTYLLRLNIRPTSSLRESLQLAIVWIALSFCFDAIAYILVVPSLSHTAPNWAFFRDQSPWIWFSYTVLLLSAWVGRWGYLRRIDA